MAAGTIVFGADVEPFTGATAYIRLEDVTRADAPARVTAETILRDVRIDGQGAKELQFIINVPALERSARYVLRVHVDLDGDGQVGFGDYVSTASHPILPGDNTSAQSIPVRRVT